MENFKLSKDFETFRMFIKPQTIQLSNDGDFSNIDRKNFEILKQAIALRAVPETVTELKMTTALKELGSTKFDGNGYTWDFAIEAVGIFEHNGSSVGLLVKELEGIVLPCGSVLHTGGEDCNIEFIPGQFAEEYNDDKV